MHSHVIQNTQSFVTNKFKSILVFIHSMMVTMHVDSKNLERVNHLVLIILPALKFGISQRICGAR